MTITTGVFTPRPDQQQAAQAALSHLTGGTRATIVSACGTGKTLVAVMVAAGLRARRTMVAVPTVDLLGQTARVWSLAGRGGRTLAVCGSREVLDGHAGDGHVTTAPGELAALASVGGEVTAFCTYASLPSVMAAHAEYGLPPWDLMIIDEAHRTAGLLGKSWGALHHDQDVPAARRLYLTATPRIIDSDDSILASMDDEDLYGPVVHRLDTGDAISAGLLADYEILVPVLDDAALLARLQDGEPTDRARLTALQVAVLKAAQTRNLTRLLTYHHRVAIAREFAETLPATARQLPFDEQPPALWSGWISGRHSTAERAHALAALADPAHYPAVLANSRVLGEGVDVPTLDSVVFADPKASIVEIVQAVGRALRLPAGSGKRAVIIVPVFLGAEETPEDVLDSSSYAPLWRTLRALHAHDSRIAERVGDLRTLLRSVSGENSQDWLTFTGNINPKLLAGAIHLRTVSIRSKEWRRGYQAALEYHAAHGDVDCTQTYVHDGVALGKWLSWQRHLHSTGQLPDERRQLLDELGMTWAPRRTQWEIYLQYARRYTQLSGHLVPDMSEQIDGFPIGKWLRNLRVRAERGEVPEDRIAQLAAIDPFWNPGWRTSWQRAYYQLRTFVAEHGHADVPAAHRTAEGTELGAWLAAQRKSRETLAAEQISLLEDLGVQWQTVSAHEQKWLAGLEAARRYHAEHGDLACSSKYVDGHGFKLGIWLANKRRRGDRLDPDQRKTLDFLGMRW